MSLTIDNQNKNKNKNYSESKPKREESPVDEVLEEDVVEEKEVTVEEEPATHSILTGKIVNCQKVNFRSNPKQAEANVIKILTAGTTVEIQGPAEDNGFTKVKVDDKTGYIMSKFIEV